MPDLVVPDIGYIVQMSQTIASNLVSQNKSACMSNTYFIILLQCSVPHLFHQKMVGMVLPEDMTTFNFQVDLLYLDVQMDTDLLDREEFFAKMMEHIMQVLLLVRQLQVNFNCQGARLSHGLLIKSHKSHKIFSIFLVVPCSDPTPANGYINIFQFTRRQSDDGSFLEHTIIGFGCNSGYTLVLSDIIKLSGCTPNGTWVPPVPHCIHQGN